jgi:PAS domain S-box-containing protein
MERVTGGGENRAIGKIVELAASRKDGREIPVELSLATWMLKETRYYTGILRDLSERKEAENKFRSVAESAIDAIISADESGRILSWNSAAERIFGYTSSETVGEPLDLIIPERYRDAHRAGMRRVTEGSASRVIGQTVELAGVRKEGDEIPIELSLSTWMLDGSRFYAGIIRDISARKAAETQLKVYSEELARKHEELRAQHEELQRSQEALVASHQQAAHLFSVMTDALPGAVLNGKYRLGDKIGEGGFGVVFEATQVMLEREVAIKMFRPPTQESEAEQFERFRREGISSCRVNHPNAVAVLDSGISERGLPYLVLERLEGVTMAELLGSHGIIRVPRALRALADVSSVLASAHASGIIHRDIKPANVFLHADGVPGREVVKVLDFGIARLMDDERAGATRVTQTGQFVGTPMYMAPERLQGLSETGAADVYSVAVMLYELLTGSGPFSAGANVWTTLWMQVHVNPRPLDRLNPQIPPALCDLALRGLAKNPDDRPSASEFESALRVILETLPDDAEEPVAPPENDGCQPDGEARTVSETFRLGFDGESRSFESPQACEPPSSNP